VPTLRCPDGVQIHWEEQGEGPLIVFAPYWSGRPGVFSELFGDLARDHRVLSYDARGAGGSTRLGPYDLQTDAADLEALLEERGPAAAALGLANGANLATAVAAARPDLIRSVVAIGTAPIWVGAFEGTSGMLSSPTVIEAFLEMLERDYRGALRAILTATNTQMSEAELRDRVASQADYCPREAAVSRVRAWVEDDPRDAARALGPRLAVLRGRDVAGPWLPPEPELTEVLTRLLPEARLLDVQEGAVSRPDEAAEAIRGIIRVSA
jgi:pimeloyl-ACP methyl ester carboxylesterase